MLVNRIYYGLKPFIPRRLQISLRRAVISRKRGLYEDVWPIDERAGVPPSGWRGWPEGKRFAVVLTHDVDTAGGQERCAELMAMEETLGFRSSFNFVPERYPVSAELRALLASRGFEVGVHDLYHDGKLYWSRREFQRRAARINGYLKEWGCSGFRSAAMHSNLKWIMDLEIEYDTSTFDTDPFEPQPEGAGTIFPFMVANGRGGGYVELPYTLPQDFTVFVLMKEKSIDIWKRKLDWVAERGGMALVNVHPDYISFRNTTASVEQYPAEFYEDLLRYLLARHEGRYWHALPRDVARFWAMSATAENSGYPFVKV